MTWKNSTRSVVTLLGGVLAACIIKIIWLTIRWVEFKGCRIQPQGAAIVAFWHGRMLMIPCLYYRVWARRSKRPYMLISQHGDGRLIALAVRLLGILSIAGSSTRGGRKALLQLIRKGREGHDLGITPDGPRGPRHVCKEGVALVAQKTGLPVYPFCYSTDRTWQLRSWDGMIIPKPFSRGVLVVGDPLFIREEEGQESACQRIQEALDEVRRQADAYWSPS